MLKGIAADIYRYEFIGTEDTAFFFDEFLNKRIRAGHEGSDLRHLLHFSERGYIYKFHGIERDSQGGGI